jgi:hypothetical protein
VIVTAKRLFGALGGSCVVAAYVVACSAPRTGESTPQPVLHVDALQPSAVASASSAVGAQSVASAPVRVTPTPACDLDVAVGAFERGTAPEQCGDLPFNPSEATYEAARSCVLAAIHGKRAFMASWRWHGIDSSFRHVVAAHGSGPQYEIRLLDFDTCPAGCGESDPASWAWTAWSCKSIEDTRAACKLPPTKDQDPDRVAACVRAPSRAALELICVGRSAVDSCPAPQP